MEVNTQFSLEELSVLVELPRRTIRYYIQVGLVDRPIGEKRAAYYTPSHLERLLTIKKWTHAGLSLERVRELLDGDDNEPPIPTRRVGSIEVRSHLLVAPGIELVVDPNQAGLSAEQLRVFLRGAIDLYNGLTEAEKI